MYFSWMNDILTGIMDTLPRMVGPFSYLLGTVCLMQATRKRLVFSGPFKFSWKSERLHTLFYLSLGVILFYFPSTLHPSSLSIFKLNHLGSAFDVKAYHELHQPENWREVRDIMIKYSSLIGIIAFVRGWYLLLRNSYLGERNKTAHAVLYMISGILLINMINTLSI